MEGVSPFEIICSDSYSQSTPKQSTLLFCIASIRALSTAIIKPRFMIAKDLHHGPAIASGSLHERCLLGGVYGSCIRFNIFFDEAVIIVKSGIEPIGHCVRAHMNFDYTPSRTSSPVTLTLSIY